MAVRSVAGEDIRRRHFALASLLLVASALTVQAAEVRLAGAGASWEGVAILTNSVTCAAILDGTNHTMRAAAESESALAFAPSWDAWRPLSDVRLDIWVEAVADGSNVVSVLFGTPEAPALIIACADDWSLHPAGAAPPDASPPATYGVVTQALHVAIYPRKIFGEGSSLVRSRDAAGVWRERPDLALTSFGWVAAEQAISNWPQVGVALAGPDATLRSLRMRWAPDATLMILR
jgi:hypothetical protein